MSSQKYPLDVSTMILGEIMLDEQSEDDHPIKHLNVISHDGETNKFRRRKSLKFQNQKSHRVIEKRRRDRMNQNLDLLLELIPHKKPDNDRRIEKTEIIEMAVKYIQNMKCPPPKSLDPIDLNRKTNLKIDAYSSGYHNAACDIYEYLEKHTQHQRSLSDFIRFIKEQELALKNLSVVPARKDFKMSAKNFSSSSPTTNPDDSSNFYQFSIDDRSPSLPSNTQVPIFVLHPSGTHYIPMSVDLSLVSHAFHSKSSHEQPPCHPISIPVNFTPHPISADPYEIDIQNINVIATRHQTSVRPN